MGQKALSFSNCHQEVFFPLVKLGWIWSVCVVDSGKQRLSSIGSSAILPTGGGQNELFHGISFDIEKRKEISNQIHSLFCLSGSNSLAPGFCSKLSSSDYVPTVAASCSSQGPFRFLSSDVGP